MVCPLRLFHEDMKIVWEKWLAVSSHNSLMFKEDNHLNAFGADNFTSMICSKIKELNER